jgi:hypothetical protein
VPKFPEQKRGEVRLQKSITPRQPRAPLEAKRKTRPKPPEQVGGLKKEADGPTHKLSKTEHIEFPVARFLLMGTTVQKPIVCSRCHCKGSAVMEGRDAIGTCDSFYLKMRVPNTAPHIVCAGCGAVQPNPSRESRARV